MNILECAGLHQSYATPLLRGVDLGIAAGERVALVGRSGSGKSTLVRALLALQSVQAGTVRCLDRAVRPGPVRRLRWFRRLVQYVPQDPASTLDPRARVCDLVAEPIRRLSGTTGHELHAAVDAALDAVRLPVELHDAYARELSGGQAQRVAIALALGTEPRLLIADEPISGLDAPLRAQVVDALRLASQTRGTALLLVSHDLSAAVALCERIVVLHDGRTAEDRLTGDLLAGPEHSVTRELLAAVPTLPARTPAIRGEDHCALEEPSPGCRRCRPAAAQRLLQRQRESRRRRQRPGTGGHADAAAQRADPVQRRRVQTVPLVDRGDLVTLDPDGIAQPALATAFAPQPDATTWRFEIREGVTFHDGSRLTVPAVVAALTAATKASPQPRILDGVKLTVRPDPAAADSAILVTTGAADPLLPQRLSSPQLSVLATAAYDAGGAVNPVGHGTGPFKLISSSTSGAKLDRYDGYWETLDLRTV